MVSFTDYAKEYSESKKKKKKNQTQNQTNGISAVAKASANQSFTAYAKSYNESKDSDIAPFKTVKQKIVQQEAASITASATAKMILSAPTRTTKVQTTSAFDDAMVKKYSTMSLADIEKEYARIEAEEKKFKEENGNKFINYLAKYGSYIGEGISGQNLSSARAKSDSNIDKIDDYAREKEILSIYRKQRATEEYLGGLDEKQLQLLDNIAKADDLDNAAPFVMATQQDNPMASYLYAQQTSPDKEIAKTSRETLYKQLQKKNPNKSDEEISELIDNMVELRKNQVNAERQEETETQLKELSSEHSIAAFLLSRGANLLGGPVGLSELWNQRNNEYGLDTNAAGFSLTKASTTIDEQIQLDHDWEIEVGGASVDAFDFFYKTGSGIVDNLGRFAISGGNTTAAGALMFTQGTTQSIISGKEKGYSDAKALTLGLLDGTFEAISEKISLDRILKSDGGVLKTLANSFAAEGSEELASNWLNRIAEQFANGKHSDLAKMYEAYINEGYTESQALAEVVLSVIGEDIESFLIGGLSGVVMGGGVAISNSKKANKLTENEQKVYDKVVEDRIAEATEDGKKLTKAEEKKIREDVRRALDRGYIDTDTIESVLGGEEFETYKRLHDARTKYEQSVNDEIKALQEEHKKLQEEYKELNKLAMTEATLGDHNRQAEIKERQKEINAKIGEVKAELKELEADTSVSDLKARFDENFANVYKGSRLEESYRERLRANEDFQADFSKYKGTKYEEAAKKTLENAINFTDSEGKKLNNTNAVHDLIDMQAKISAETGEVFYYKTGEQIKNDFIERQTKLITELENIPEAQRTEEQNSLLAELKDTLQKVQSGEVTVNGDITADGITINLDAKNPLNRLTGHEITHSFENAKSYEKLRDALFAYAKTKGVDIDARKAELEAKYKGIKNANPEAELVADLVGDYIFTDPDFVRHLSVNNRNVFQKIYDEIKYLYKLATAGSKEARQLEKVLHQFEKVYREGGSVEGGTINYALMNNETFEKNTEDIINMTDEVALKNKEQGNFVRVMNNTPSVILENVKGSGDYEVIIRFDALYLAARKDGALEGHYHNLGKDIIANLPQFIENPDAIVRMNNGRLNIFTIIETSKGNNGIISMEMNTVKDINSKNNKYNLVVSVFSAKDNYTKNNLIKNGVKVEYKKEDLSQVNHQLYEWLATINDKSSDDILPQNSEKSIGEADYSLSSEQETYFKDSKVRDENGNLKVMYHGTSKGGHTVFDTYGSNYGLFGTGSYFTDNKSVAESYTNKGKGNNKQVYETYLNITNPLDMDAEADVNAWSKAFPDADFTNCTTNEDCYRAMEEYFEDEQYSKWEASEIAVDAIRGMGYDGITHIGGGRVNADGVRHQVYIAFEPEQIKNIDNIAPTRDADIRYSLTETDNKYLEAVKSGDTETAQRMVDEAARENGYTIKGFHATNADFTAFDIDKTSDVNFHGKGIYFTNSTRDVENNYENYEGPDPWQKIEARAYELADEKYGFSYEDTLTGDADIIDKLNECYDEAIEEFKSTIHRVTAYLKFDNPLILKKGDNKNYDLSQYDGIIDEQVYENIGHSGMDENTVHYVVFNPHNIKSADTVTYDDNGNVIPLSERFKAENNDIRYSLTEDSEGRELSKGKRDFFKNSKIKDADGNLKVMYHGSHETFTVFDKKKARSSGTYGKGFYFTDSKSHAGTYGDSYEVYLNITNPLQNGTNDITKDQLRKFVEAIAEDEDYGIENYGYGATIDSVTDSVYGKSDFGMLLDLNVSCIGNMVEAVELFNRVNGTDYDGIVAPTETVAFYPNQIKSVTNEKPTDNPDIRFSLSENVEETKELMALHNLKSNELLKTLDLGGLAMPSIAIIKAEAGHDKYGDVSLILPKESIDPKTSEYNKVYGGDAWTPTHPRIEYKANEKVEKRIRDKYYDLARKVGYDAVRPMYRYVSELEDVLNRDGGESAMLDSLYNDTDMMQVYLEDSGKGKVEPIVKETRTELNETEKAKNQWFIDKLGEDVVRAFKTPVGANGIAHRKAFMAEHKDEVMSAWEGVCREVFHSTDEQVQNVLSATTDSMLVTFVRDAERYLNNGGISVKSETDYEATRNAIKEKAADGYKNWIDNLFAGVEERKGIRNNLDAFTSSGNRRSWNALHWENTLENVVKAMRMQDQTGADAIAPISSIFAVAQKQYGSIDEIKSDSERLSQIPEEEYKALEESYASRLVGIAESIKSPNERNSYIAIDNAAELIVDAVRNYKTKSGMLKYMQKWNSRVTSETVDDIVSLVNDIANMPTGYFEAKPQRAVGFDEVAVFVIPYDADVKLKQELLNKGYSIAEYDPKIEGDRQRVVNSFEQYKFSLSDVGEQFTPHRNDIYGKDILYKPTDIAPIRETVSKAETVEDIAPTKEYEAIEPRPKAYEDEEAQWAKNKMARADKVNDAETKPTRRSELHHNIMEGIKTKFTERGFDFDEVLKKAKNLTTVSTNDNTPQRVMEKALGYKQGQILADETVNKVAQNESAGIKWLNSFTDRKNGLLAQISKQYNIKPGSKKSAAAQMYAEGFYVNKNNDIVKYGDRELAIDFPDARVRENIKGLARDPRIRQIYDETLAAINESRRRNLYPEIQRLDNYFLHFRAMEDTFSRLGLPFNPNDIRAYDLPTDLNGVTADLKPGQPYFASAMHREGMRTSFDLLGGLERYLSSAKNQIYHIDDIQTLRALRNYIADTYGQAKGLESLDSLSEEEAQERITQVYNSHLSTFAKFLHEEANVLAGKKTLIDRGIEGAVGRKWFAFFDTVNRQVGSNMVGFNVSSSLTNFLPVVQTFAKTNKFDFTKAFTQTVASKIGSIYGKTDSFVENNPTIIRRKGAERFYRTPFQKVGDTGYVLMSAVDDISTELIVRTKYNELTRKGMDEQKAAFEADKWVSRLMGDRSLGQMPLWYNSKMLGLVTKFQLEVRNQLDSQFYDTIQEAKVSNENIENGLLRNAKTAAKIGSTFFQLAVAQHIFGKAFESVAGYNPAFDIIEVLIKTLGLDDDEEDEDTAWDNIKEGFFALLEDLPYTSVITDGGRIPISSALPVKQFFSGKDQYGNEKPRMETLGETAPYYLLPTGYGQIKKSVQGLNMFSDEHPIAGSYTDSGNLRYPVEDTLQNRIQAGIFGQYANETARDYFDNERSPLKEKQIQEFIDVEMPIADYWQYREDLKELDTLEEKFDFIADMDLPVEKKNILINNIVDRKEDVDLENYDDFENYEEFDFYTKNTEKYEFLESQGVSYKEYKADEDTKEKYDNIYSWYKNNPDKVEFSRAVTDNVVKYREITSGLYEIRADKDSNGKTINGSAKKKKQAYIWNLDIDDGAKYILFKNEYNSVDDYNYEIIDYLNNRADISYEEMETILKQIGFEVDAYGNISW